MSATAAAPELRDYQLLAVSSAENAIGQGHSRMHLSMPTGSGKTVVLGRLARHVRRNPVRRVLAVAHVRELVNQLAAGLSAGTNEPVGVVMAAANDPGAGVVVGSVQTLTGARLDAVLDAGPVTLLIIDECHHCTGTNAYARLVARVAQAWPDVVVIGTTATPFRADRGQISDVLPYCAFERSIAELSAAGWLAPLTWQHVELDDLDLDSVPTRKADGEADYRADELATAMRQPGLVQATAELTAPLLGDRLTVVFAADVAHAHELADAYRGQGLAADTIYGAMRGTERAALLAAWRDGTVQIVCSVGTLLEGFDYPELSAAVIARPTQSPGRYMQMIGRITRTVPGKTNSLVVDVSGSPFGPGSFAARQIVLPVILGRMPQTNTVDGEEQRPVEPHRTLLLVDPLGQSKIEWATDTATGVLYASVGPDAAAALVPDTTGSGLYAPVIVSTRGGADPLQFLSQGNTPGDWMPLRDAVGAVAFTLARNGRLPSLTDKQARWRQQQPSPQQLKFLASLDPAAAQRARDEDWARGTVALEITGKLALAQLRKALR